MVDSCPLHNTDKNLESLCTARSTKGDLSRTQPVSDLQNKTTYKNKFCAMCNQASNLTYWKYSASCEDFSSHDFPTNRSLTQAFIMGHPERECYFEPPRVQSEKICLALEQNCPDSELVDEEPLLRDLCSFYVVPFSPRRKNPHCDICEGRSLSRYPCKWWEDRRLDSTEWPLTSVREGPLAGAGVPEGPLGGVPPFNIIFDSPPSDLSVQVGETKTVVRNKECAEGFVFDPSVEKCVQIYFPTTDPEMDLANITGSKNKSYIKGLQEGTNINCSHVQMNISSVTLLSNDSLWVPLHKRIYNKESYVINGSSLLVCVDFKRTYTETEIETETLVSTKISPLQIITYIGCAISMISLIFLLGIYIALSELRTLPGKNLINLSCAMLLYQIFFLLTGQNWQTKSLYDGIHPASLFFAVFILLDGRDGVWC